MGDNVTAESLLKRAMLYLEDEKWSKANRYCEYALDIEPENAGAYLGKLMAELNVHRKEELKEQMKPFDGNANYIKAVRFADYRLSDELSGYIAYINERNVKQLSEELYKEGVTVMNSAETEEEFRNAALKFKEISGFKDAYEL